MARGDFNRYRGKMPMADMNVVPLVDVMLVLLVIFIVTAPLLTHSVKIELPKASSSPNITRPEHIEFGIREERRALLERRSRCPRRLPARFAAEAPGSPSRKCISAPTVSPITRAWRR
jgi:biopolymer transport protein ExbD